MLPDTDSVTAAGKKITEFNSETEVPEAGNKRRDF